MPGRFLSALPLRHQLFLAIFLLLVPLVGAVTWSGWLGFQERGSELGLQAEAEARMIAAFIDRDPQHQEDVFRPVPVPDGAVVATSDRGSHVLLEVEDTGPGVRPGDEFRLFEPFFTTKPVGQGTGLGLSISYGIIESLGGVIGHRPAPASGATFAFELPATGRG